MVTLRGSDAPPIPMPKIRLLLLSVLVLVALLTFGAGSAAAKAPCWKTLMNDWYDGRIDGTYKVSCYKEAIRHLPQDLQDYSQARSDLSRALLAAIATNDRSGGPPMSDNSLVPPRGKRHLQGTKKDESFWERVANKLGPGNGTSIPLPLMLLAGVGLLIGAAASPGIGTPSSLLADACPAAAAVGLPRAAPTAPAPPVGGEAVPAVPPEVADGVAVTGPD